MTTVDPINLNEPVSPGTYTYPEGAIDAINNSLNGYLASYATLVSANEILEGLPNNTWVEEMIFCKNYIINYQNGSVDITQLNAALVAYKARLDNLITRQKRCDEIDGMLLGLRSLSSLTSEEWDANMDAVLNLTDLQNAANASKARIMNTTQVTSIFEAYEQVNIIFKLKIGNGYSVEISGTIYRVFTRKGILDEINNKNFSLIGSVSYESVNSFQEAMGKLESKLTNRSILSDMAQVIDLMDSLEKLCKGLSVIIDGITYLIKLIDRAIKNAIRNLLKIFISMLNISKMMEILDLKNDIANLMKELSKNEETLFHLADFRGFDLDDIVKEKINMNRILENDLKTNEMIEKEINKLLGLFKESSTSDYSFEKGISIENLGNENNFKRTTDRIFTNLKNKNRTKKEYEPNIPFVEKLSLKEPFGVSKDAGIEQFGVSKNTGIEQFGVSRGNETNDTKIPSNDFSKKEFTVDELFDRKAEAKKSIYNHVDDNMSENNKSRVLVPPGTKII